MDPYKSEMMLDTETVYVLLLKHCIFQPNLSNLDTMFHFLTLFNCSNYTFTKR
jgi:hypothetical protein